MVARRMLLIVAILMGITALTAGLAAPPRPRTPVAATPPPASGGTGDAVLVRRTLDAGADKPRTIALEEGDHLVLTVRADALDSVEVEGLDRLVAVAPGTPAVFDMLLDRPGAYPVVLREADQRVGTLRVTPREE